jgi:hypothetical protein
MVRVLASAAVLLGIMLAVPTPAQAQSTDQMAMKVPLDVIEVVSGGEWTHDGASGAYRALVLLGQVGDAVQSSVYVQWIGTKGANGTLAIIRSVVIRDVNVRKFTTANVVIEGDTPNEATVIVTGVDPKTEQPVVLAYKATRPGMVEAIELPEAYKTQEGAAPASPAPATKN